MKFEVYEIKGISAEQIFKEKDNIAELLKKAQEYQEHNLKYCINNIDIEESIIGGTLSQEYIGGLVTVKNKVETPIEDNPWERTYFFIDTVTNRLLLERRKYSPKKLKHGIAERRLISILSDTFLEYFGGTISILKTSVGVNNEYFRGIIEKEDIKSLQVVNLLGKKIPVGTPLHNPREAWDKVWAESWNTYDSEYVEEVFIKTNNENNLNKSVLSKAMLATNAEIKSVGFYDSDLEKPVLINRNSVGSINVDANKDEEPVTIKKKSFMKIKKSRDVIKRFFTK